MALARKRKLTVYDAAYLELAQRERLPLATLDRGLEKAASPKASPCSGLDPAAVAGPMLRLRLL